MSEDEKQRLAASSGLLSIAIDRIGETVMGSKNTTTVIDWAIFKAPEFLGFLSQGVKVIIHFLPDSEGKDDDDDSEDEEEEDDDVEENIYHRHERFRRRHRRNASSMYAEKKKLEVERRDKARLEERTRRVTRVMFLTDNKTTLKLMRLVGEELVEAEEIPVHLLRDVVLGCNSDVFFKSLQHLNGSLDCHDSLSQKNRCFSIFLDAPSPFDRRKILDLEIQLIASHLQEEIVAANKITIGLGVVIQMQLMDIRDILQEAANRNGFLAQAIEEEDEDFDIEEGSSRGGFGFPGAEIFLGSEEECEFYVRVLGVVRVHDGM
jgi:hypothetical protein